MCRSCLVSLVLLGLACFSGRAVDYVLQISVDGLRGDLLGQYVAASPASYPNFTRLQTQGASTYNARCDYELSETVPNHTTMVTGRPVRQPEGFPSTVHHGYDINFPGPNDTLHANGNPYVDYIFSVFDVAHDQGLSTALYAGKTRLDFINRSYDAVNGAEDVTGANYGRDKIDYSIIIDGLSDSLVDAVTDKLTNAPVNYTFLHLVEPDMPYGHANGWGTVEWIGALSLIDGFLGRIFAAIDANTALHGNIAIILTGDHGGGGNNLRGHTDATHIFNYTVPFFVWGPGVPAGSSAYNLFVNRFDPGTSRPPYGYDSQPIRNGDAPNLALHFLGLPNIPGSFLEAEMGSPDPSIAIERDGDTLELTWRRFPPGMVLETSSALPAASWQPIRIGIEDKGPRYGYQVLSPLVADQSFYRLRQRAFSITGQPASVTVHATATVTLRVTTSGEVPLSYQWRREGVDIDGANLAEYVLPSALPNDAGMYTVVVADALDVLESNPATVTVLTQPTITQQPLSQVVAGGSSVTFSVAAVGSGPLQYQWFHNDIEIAGATGASHSVANVQASDEGNYVVVVTDAFGSTTSHPATLAVPVKAFIVTHPQSKTVTVGDTVAFTVTIGGNPPPFGYRWRRSATTKEYQSIPERTSTFTISNVQLTDAGNYSVVVTNSATLIPGNSAVSSTAVLTVLPP